MFEAGAGRIGNYDCCAWECLGEGQFRPLKGSKAWQGEVDVVEKITELKVEMVCEDNLVQKTIATMKQAHPYETPAYDVWKLWDEPK